jgi:hypothetical protein
MKESEFASLETVLYDIKARCSASPARTEHLNYFLEGIRNDAKKLVNYSNSAQWLTIHYGFMPTFLKPFESIVQEKISDRLGNAFAAAKCLYDNLNRFLQAAYLPEEEILKRKQKISKSSEDISTAWGKAYELNKFDRIDSGENPYIKALVSQMDKINESNDLTRIVRNAAFHGHGHVLLDKDEKGFFIAESLSKPARGNSQRIYAENVLEGLSNFYLGLANKYLGEFLEQSKDLQPVTSGHKIKSKAKNIASNASGFSKLYFQYMISPLAAIMLGLGVANSFIEENHVQARQHKDQQTIRQLRELSDFQRQVIETNKKAQKFADAVDHLVADSNVMLSYTNVPADVDTARIRDILDKLQKTAHTLRSD